MREKGAQDRTPALTGCTELSQEGWWEAVGEEEEGLESMASWKMVRQERPTGVAARAETCPVGRKGSVAGSYPGVA